MASKARDIADLGSNDVLETTSTGVDVTGTITADAADIAGAITADGLTVDGTTSLAGLTKITGVRGTFVDPSEDPSVPNIFSTNDAVGDFSQEAGHLVIQPRVHPTVYRDVIFAGGAGTTKRLMNIKGEGDVEFFEDTGTTAKMVWSSSAESLNLGGIATTNTAGFSQNLALKDLYPSITLEDTSAGTAKYTIGATSGALGIWDSSASAYRMFINSSGNVGIGTNSPSTKLMLEHSNDGAVGGTTRIKDRDSQQVDNQLTGAIEFESQDATVPTSGVSTAIKSYVKSTSGGAYLTLSTTDQYTSTLDERMRIDHNGNVGIGTDSPQEELHIEANYPQLRIASDLNIIGSNNLTCTIDGHATDGRAWRIGRSFGSSDMQITNDRSSSMTFSTNSTERARIDSSGNLLVGRTSQLGAKSKLTLECNATTDDGLTINDSYSGAGSAFSVNFYRNSVKVGSITNTTSSVAYNTSSDERLKENIKYTTHTVDINDIKVREFDWKVDGSHQRYGFIAKEVETVYPEAVHSPEDADEMKSVDYSKLVPLLVKENKQLKAEIKEHKA